MIFKMKSVGISVIVSFILCGCSGYKESFARPPGLGSGWKSMNETYIFNEKSIENESTTSKASITPVAYHRVCAGQDLSNIDNTIRLPQETLRIWFAPFEDHHHTCL